MQRASPRQGTHFWCAVHEWPQRRIAQQSPQAARDRAAPEGTAKSKSGTGSARAIAARHRTDSPAVMGRGREEERGARVTLNAATAGTSQALARAPGLEERKKTVRAIVLHRHALRERTVLRTRSGGREAVAYGHYRKAGPNPSVKPSPNGGPRGPGRRYVVHSRQPGPRVPPSVPAYLKR